RGIWLRPGHLPTLTGNALNNLVSTNRLLRPVTGLVILVGSPDVPLADYVFDQLRDLLDNLVLVAGTLVWFAAPLSAEQEAWVRRRVGRVRVPALVTPGDVQVGPDGRLQSTQPWRLISGPIGGVVTTSRQRWIQPPPAWEQPLAIALGAITLPPG